MVKTKKTQQDKTKVPEPSNSKAKPKPVKETPAHADKDTKWSDAGFNESELTLSQLKNMITTLATEVYDNKKEELKAEVDEDVEARLYDQSNDVEETVDELKNEVESLKEENKSLKEEYLKLKRRTERLEFEVSNKDKKIRELKIHADAVEQQLYDKDLQLVGVPEIPSGDDVESDLKTVIKLVQDKMNINIKPTDVENIHRQGKRKSDKTRDIVIRFRKTAMRNQIFTNRKKTATHSDPKRNIYVNDKLTEYRRDLLYAARQLVKHKKIMAAWSQQGNILIRKTEEDSVIHVTCHDQLAELTQEPDETEEPMEDTDIDSD